MAHDGSLAQTAIKKKKRKEKLNLVVNISKELIQINSAPFCIDDYVNKCNAVC